MLNENAPIQELPLGTLYEQLHSLFDDPKSLWVRVKRDASNQIIESYVYTAITAEEARFKIIESYLKLKFGSNIADAFSRIQDFAVAVSKKGTIYISDLQEVVNHLETITDYKPDPGHGNYLSSYGRLFATKLMAICEWLCCRV